MRLIIPSLFIISVLLISSGCKGGKNKAVGTQRSGTTETIATTNTSGSTEEIYQSLPLLELPLEANAELLQKLRAIKPLEESVFRRLTDIGIIESPYNGSARAVRLPQNDGKRFLLVGYLENDQWTMDLYSLSMELKPIDRLRLYSLEKLNGGKSVIAQTFSLQNNYRSEVSKRLNGTLIERLTYLPAAAGSFEELRDGKTTTVAYDSYDGVNYIVETFIWDRNGSGGLIKKNLRTENYRIDENGDLVK